LADAASLGERLENLESRTAIEELIHAYARCIRRDLPDEAPLLFLPDGVFEIRDGHPHQPEHQLRARLEGREHILFYLTQGKGKTHPIPLIHNLMIEVNGDTATANCVMEAQVYGTPHKVLGEYNDTFRRVDGKWFFAARTYTIFKGGSSV
jgi:hypothetical protein